MTAAPSAQAVRLIESLGQYFANGTDWIQLHPEDYAELCRDFAAIQSALAAAERERDALENHRQQVRIAAGLLPLDHGGDVCERIAAMRAKLLELACECAECGGSGETTIRGMCGGVEMDCDNQPCPHCADIREAAGQ